MDAQRSTRLERTKDRSKAQRSRPATGTKDIRRPCVFEKTLSDHIQAKILEERVHYDAALVRADAMLSQTRKLREQVRDLAEEYLGLENRFQHVNTLNTRFKRVAKERLEYLDNQSHLAGLIASLMRQYEDEQFVGPTPCPRDWKNRKLPGDPQPGRRMSRHKRRLVHKLLCARGMDRDL